MTGLQPTPVLTTARLILRAPVAADWPHWLAFAQSDRAAFILDGNTDPSFAWRVLGHAVGHWVLRGYGMFVIALRGEDRPLGMAGPWFPEGWPEREIGWTIWTAEAEGKGYALEATTAARDFAFGTLGWDTAVSYVNADNARSIALARRLGATLDRDAAAPDFDESCLVFRHPAPARSERSLP
ncbi:GNAT family N-acetyltransferase [Paracoccus spongiarum]|uniref:GNAT family N-acetyltransferase n=1 Tax=Paracoccus spongiarum TaxID=3064387 RepID=A0ABT9JCU2_9RHOB|nr:GNAT family N-acetyltransferase [Paracoccus sp. 2205BS29-5]MDP5307648.1 GNAT family N-acetyltransferase [Paracoccus sp. 2205BS29-5]